MKINNYSNNIKAILILAIILGIHGLFFGESRMALAGLIVLIFAIFFKFNKHITFIFFGLLWMLPFWYTPIATSFVDSDILNFLKDYSRIPSEATYELITLNQRTETWRVTINFMIDNFNISNFSFGYGTRGHAITGLYQSYAFIFPGISDTELQVRNLHNTPLQVLFNYGFIGFFLFTYMIIISIYNIKRYAINLLIILLVLIGCFTPSIALNPKYFSFILMLFILFSNTYSYNNLVILKKYDKSNYA